jgi:hypothetical protein
VGAKLFTKAKGGARAKKQTKEQKRIKKAKEKPKRKKIKEEKKRNMEENDDDSDESDSDGEFETHKLKKSKNKRKHVSAKDVFSMATSIELAMIEEKVPTTFTNVIYTTLLTQEQVGNGHLRAQNEEAERAGPGSGTYTYRLFLYSFTLVPQQANILLARLQSSYRSVNSHAYDPSHDRAFQDAHSQQLN